MKFTEFQALAEAAFERRRGIFQAKSHDYADADTLSNFKRMAKGLKDLSVPTDEPYGVAAFFVLHKLDRILNILRQSRCPSNESLADSFDDLRNYVDLMEALITDY